MKRRTNRRTMKRRTKQRIKRRTTKRRTRQRYKGAAFPRTYPSKKEADTAFKETLRSSVDPSGKPPSMRLTFPELKNPQKLPGQGTLYGKVPDPPLDDTHKIFSESLREQEISPKIRSHSVSGDEGFLRPTKSSQLSKSSRLQAPYRPQVPPRPQMRPAIEIAKAAAQRRKMLKKATKSQSAVMRLILKGW